MNRITILCCLLAASMYPNVYAQRGGRQGGRRQRDPTHQMPPGGMQGPPPGMPQEQGTFNLTVFFDAITKFIYIYIYIYMN